MLEQKSLNEGYSPLDALNQALRFWWFLFVLIVIGGIGGYLFHQARPPVYEAIGYFNAGIDYVATGPLSQYDEDVALNTVSTLLLSKPVFDRVAEKAQAEGINLDRDSLMKMATIERKFTTFDLRIRSSDAQLALRIATLWVEQGQILINESYLHAVQADLLNRYINTLESCLGKSVSSEPSTAICTRYRFTDIQADLRDAGEAFIRERKASLGLFTGVLLGPAQQAVLSPKPVMYGRNQLVLAGIVVGLVAGVWLLHLGIPARWMKRS